MFGLATPSRIYLAMAPTDMRKQENWLLAVIRASLDADPADGALFVFVNKAKDRVKMLHWDGIGVWVISKRLEKAASAGRHRARPGSSRSNPRR